MENKERLKPLSLYGLDLKEALHAMLSVDPRKIDPKKVRDEETNPPKKPTKPRPNTD